MTQLPWAEVKKEMTQEKGLDPTVADKIGQYVKHKGTGLEGKHHLTIPPPSSDPTRHQKHRNCCNSSYRILLLRRTRAQKKVYRR